VFDPTKPVQTRDGRPARILAQDLVHPNYTYVAAIMREDGCESAIVLNQYGRQWAGVERPSDLINIPERVTKYLNLYKNNGGGRYHSSLEEASDNRCTAIHGILALTFEDDKLVSVELVHG
jgi:hypothetical protein